MPKKMPDNVPWKIIGKPLGSGGQGTIYEVEPIDSEQFPNGKYIMKKLRNIKSSKAIARFTTEIKAISRLDDPRIVSIVDHSKADSSFQYYVMPKCDVVTLSEIIDKKESPFLKNPHRCLDFVADCAEALYACHENQVVHRDIKPGNILVDKTTYAPTILDFGCCQLDGGNDITSTNERVGSLDYMAPECESGSIDAVPYEADIYSLGKLLWVLITGKPVFAREERAFNSLNLNRILSDNPDCWHLTTIFEKSIRNKISERYSSCVEMAEHCRSLSRNFVGKYPPLEKVSEICPACGTPVNPNYQSLPYEIQPKRLHGSLVTYHQGVDIDCCQCTTCGYIYLWNKKLLSEKLNRFKTME